MINQEFIEYCAKFNDITGDMAAEILASRAEIARLRAIVDTPIKLPSKYGFDTFDQLIERNNDDGFLYYVSEVVNFLKEHGLRVAEDE